MQALVDRTGAPGLDGTRTYLNIYHRTGTGADGMTAFTLSLSDCSAGAAAAVGVVARAPAEEVERLFLNETSRKY